jgi:3-oxoacyl-[acyl-carrier protein] reductase
MEDLNRKVALVTGSSRGIGRAAAVALAQAGSAVAINYRSHEDKAREALQMIEAVGARGALVQADVSVGPEVARMVATVEQKLGPIDILVNNAGIIRPQAIEDIREEDWDDLIDINLKSAFLCTQAVLPGMRSRRWGRIINIASLAAQVGGIVGPHYSASKAGMLGLTHCYAKLLAQEGITVNAVNPALIETDMVVGNPHISPEMVPIGRFGTADEIATVVVLLARNGYITGQAFSVNGGMYFT